MRLFQDGSTRNDIQASASDSRRASSDQSLSHNIGQFAALGVSPDVTHGFTGYQSRFHPIAVADATATLRVAGHGASRRDVHLEGEERPSLVAGPRDDSGPLWERYFSRNAGIAGAQRVSRMPIPANGMAGNSTMADDLLSSIPGLLDCRRQTLGDPEICIAIVDSRVDLSHPCFAGAQLREIMPAWLQSVMGTSGAAHRNSCGQRHFR